MPTSTNKNTSIDNRRPVVSDTGDTSLQPARDLVNYVRTYARQKPDVAALWCFGLGIVVGWKARPW